MLDCPDCPKPLAVRVGGRAGPPPLTLGVSWGATSPSSHKGSQAVSAITFRFRAMALAYARDLSPLHHPLKGVYAAACLRLGEELGALCDLACDFHALLRLLLLSPALADGVG